MSIVPIDFEAAGGQWEVFHDDPGYVHTGFIDPTTVNYASEDQKAVLLYCPEPDCNSHSWWPAGGGANALIGQEMHVRVAILKGANVVDAISAVRARCTAMDGPDRWQLNDDQLAAALKNYGKGN